MAEAHDLAGQGGTRRQVLLLDLKDDAEAIAAYEAAHRPGGVPDAVLASIRAAGICGMTIYRCGNRLVMIMEADAGFDAAQKAAADRADRKIVDWEARMDQLQQRLPFATGEVKWVAAASIFDLGEHIGRS